MMIKKTIFAITLCCLTAGVFAQVNIEGKIEKYAGETVTFTRFEGRQEPTDTVRVEKNGSFVYKTDNTVPNAISIDGVKTFLAIQPGDRMQMNITLQNDKTVTIVFKGDRAAENNYQQKVGKLFALKSRLAAGEFPSFEVYRAVLEKQNAEALEALKAVTDPKMKAQGAEMQPVSVLGLQLEYYRNNPEKANADADFVTFIKNIDLNDYASVGYCIAGVIDWYLDGKGVTDKKMRSLCYPAWLAKLVSDPQVRNQYANEYMNLHLQGIKIPWIDEVFNAYKAVCTDTEAIDRFAAETERHLNFFRIRNGVEAPDFEVIDSTGNKVRLSDFRGKFVYIDVWATWCSPCCAEIPHVEKLHKQFAGDSRIEFISISVDSKVKAWKKKVATDNPAWKQYIEPIHISIVPMPSSLFPALC